MLNELFSYLKKPEKYSESSCIFWDDEHVSKGLLEAHLHPEWEASSRRHDFIDKSVEWISQIATPKTHRNVLDLGCGPGLYAERMDKKGYRITGMDFSRRSVQYAQVNATENNQDIHYIYKNYMEIDYKNEFDLIILIYCDFGVLSDADRKVLLKKIHEALKPGGKLIFDVFTRREFEDRKESSTWYLAEGEDFWKPDRHICLESYFIYEDDVRMEQYVIIDKEGAVDVIRNWHKLYTRDTILFALEEAGFKNTDVYSDVSGRPYCEESRTLAMVSRKQQET